MTGKVIKTITFLLLSALMSTSLLAQNLSISSQVDRTTVPLNSSLTLSVTVSGSFANSVGEPKLTTMQEFSVRPTGTSSSIEIINFKTSMSVTYTYLLVPSEKGTFEVGEAYVIYDDKEYSSSPVTVTVTDAQTSPQNQSGARSATNSQASGDDIFVVGSTDKETVYVGEQIIYTFELYNRLSISDIEYNSPETTGFWTVDLPNPSASVKTHGQYQYNYNEVKSALFPTTAGKLSIGSASVTFYPRMSFFNTGPAQRLATKPIEIMVKPLPENGKSASFSGAVGNYKITVSTESDSVSVGDIVSLTVSVTGDGNLDLVTTVSEPDWSAFRTYPSRVVDTIRNSGNIVGGVKIWEFMVSPRQQGTMIIEPFSLAFFNPVDGSYHVANTQPVTLHVLPGTPEASSGRSSDIQTNNVTAMASDIRYIKPDKTILSSVSHKVYTVWYFPFIYILSVGILIGSYLYKKRKDTIEQNSGLKRKLNAWKHAQRRLKLAQSLADSSDITGFCGHLHESITAFIGDMCNIDTGALTSIELENVLQINGVPKDRANQIRNMLEMCDFVRFASVGSGNEIRDNLLTETSEHLAKLRELL